MSEDSRKILVFNYGSSSVEASLVDARAGRVLASARVERIGPGGARLRDALAEHSTRSSTRPATPPSSPTSTRQVEAPDHAAATRILHALLRDEGDQQLRGLRGIGHRVVHGGERFREAVLIDAAVERAIEELAPLAPLHNPASLAGIRAAREGFPELPQVAVFDTAYHYSLPPRAFVYALPYELYERDGVRRYGFHGTSHRYVAERAVALLGIASTDFTGITCHLGSGASITAVEDGRSVDTSMGMTPLEGLVMGTRSGDVDPGIFRHLAASRGLGPDAIEELLATGSGLLGVSGVSADMRDVERAAAAGSERAELAIEIFAYRARKYIGAYLAALPRCQALVFTGGMGEHSASLRARIAGGLSHLGLALDADANFACSGDEAVISSRDSPATIFVVPSREEVVIARETGDVLRRARHPG